LIPDTNGSIRFGHPSGSLAVGAETEQRDGVWIVTKAIMSRSARRLMEGNLLVPASVFEPEAGHG
jgi:2-methylaconitate cis-trans-isomerase PrpF